MKEGFFRKGEENPVRGRFYFVQSAESCGARGYCHTEFCFVDHPVPVGAANHVRAEEGRDRNTTINDGGQGVSAVSNLILVEHRAKSKGTRSNDAQ